MALAYAGIHCELREVDLKNKPDEMLAISPKGTVPVLLLPTGEVIEESLEIMQWAVKQSDPDGWGAELSTEILQTFQEEFKQSLYRYKYPDRFAGEQVDVQQMQASCERFLADLNARLAKAGYVLGSRASLSDVAIFPLVRQCRLVNDTWFDALDFPALKQWLDRWLNSDCYQKAMQKEAPWQLGQDRIVFPCL
jgi:glutathione S-transferase